MKKKVNNFDESTLVDIILSMGGKVKYMARSRERVEVLCILMLQ